MIEEQKVIPVSPEELVEKVTAYKNDGYRLVQIGCAKIDETFEINYSFDKDYHFEDLKVTIPCPDAKLPSVSGVYWPAFLYENEIHDLFGINVENMALDYKGNFYRTAVKAPFAGGGSQPKEAQAKEAKA
jgi:ech hydrogenase subunit D